MNWFREPVEGEVSYDEILEKANNGEFHKWNFEPFMAQESGYEDVLEELKKYQAVDYLAYETEYKKLMKEGKEAEAQEYKAKMDAMVEDVLKIYRSKNIFPIQYFSDYGALDEIQKCIAYNAKFDGNTVSCVSGETEYFNGVEWKRIDKYEKGEKVLQFTENGECELVEPSNYINYLSDEPFYEFNDPNYPAKLTGSHNVPVVRNGEIKLVSVDSLIEYAFKHPETKGELVPSTMYFYDQEGYEEFGDVPMVMLAACINSDDPSYAFYYEFYGEELGKCIAYEDEKVKLTDRVYSLSFSDRVMLLEVLGLTPKRFNSIGHSTPITTFSSYDTACTVANLYNMTCRGEGFVACAYNDVLGGGILYFSEGENTVLDFEGENAVVDFSDYVVYRGPSKKYCFTVPSHMLVLKRNGKVFVTGNCGAGVGTGLCRWLFPNIFDTPSAHDLNKENAETQYKKFLNDTYLRRAIKFCYSYKNGCPTPTAVEGGLRLVGSAPSNFRPMNAKAIYERFCPKGGTIYDFCCVSGDTEYFNGYEWKPISDYVHGEKVLQYNEDGTAELVTPLEYISYASSDPFYEYVSTGHLRTCQTGNHDVVYKTINGEIFKIKQERILRGFDGLIPISVKYKGKDISPSKEEILSVAISLKKDDWKSGLDCYDWTLAARLELIEKIFYCDTIKLYDKRTVSLISDIIRLSGHIFSVVKSDGYWKLTWRTIGTARDEWFASYDCIRGEFREVQEKYKYCFVVPSHMLVLKRKGEIYVTGNCGFGGRLLGALSSKNNYRYVGTDPCTETMYHLHQLGEYIEQVTGREDSYELHCCGSEEFIGPEKSIDFAFSSPPYFNLEVYSDEPTQCFNKFPELDEWLEGYVRATIKNIKHMLKPGKFYAVNIADFKVGSGKTVAYVDEWIRISTEEGMPLFDTVYLGVTARAGSAEQAAGELKKENILVFKKPLW